MSSPFPKNNPPTSRKSLIPCSLFPTPCSPKFADHFHLTAHTRSMIENQTILEDRIVLENQTSQSVAPMSLAHCNSQLASSRPVHPHPPTETSPKCQKKYFPAPQLVQTQHNSFIINRYESKPSSDFVVFCRIYPSNRPFSAPRPRFATIISANHHARH